MDVFEEKDVVRIAAELPGVKADDVRISMEHNVLTIRGEKKQTADAEHIKAAYEDGVLTVTMPKVERAKPRQITVEVQKK